MGADPRIDDARWLLDWITRTNRTQFSRRDAHRAAPRGRFPKATDLEPALGCSRSTATSAASTPNPPGTRAAAADRPRRGSWSTLCHAPQKRQKQQKQPPGPFLWILSFLRRVAGVPNEGRSARRDRVRWGGQGRFSHSLPAVTLSNENGPSRSRPCLHPPPAASGGHEPAMAAGEERPRTGLGHLSGCAWPRTGSSAGELPRHGRCRDRR